MTAFWAELPGRALVRVAGAEAAGFLQALLTCDLAGAGARHGGLLSPQGKILFDLLVIPAAPDGFLLDCAAGQREELIRRLGFYRLRSKVEISADPASVSATWGDGLPDGGIADPRDAGLGRRFYGAAPAGLAAGDYEALRFSRGIAEAAEIGSGELFPHEANYDATQAVSFTKGCYVGQEVVSRMEHRASGGRARIIVAEVAGAAPARGSEVTADGKVIGHTLGQHGALALALIRLDRLAEAKDQPLLAGEPVRLRAPAVARFAIGQSS